MFKKRAVVRSYLDLANNAYIADANFHYTECGMAKLLQEYCKRLVGWFCCFRSQVNSYGHCGTVSSPNHTFSWAGLNKRITNIRAQTFACN